MTTALVSGVAGQDGAYLAKLLLQKGYRVVGTSRDAALSPFVNLQQLGIRERVETVSMVPTDFRSVLQTIQDVRPDEVYNLAGQSSVALSFSQPAATIESIAVGTLNLLDAARFLGRPVRLYNAGSSECFGDTGDHPADETTPFAPRSPYAVGKVTAHHLVANYREAYGLFACTGILFNHESPLRPERFVTQKIIRGAARIASGLGKKLVLGDLNIVRDWGWAPEYVTAMWMMLQRDAPEDFLVATGRSVSLAYFVERAFSQFGVTDWQSCVESDSSLARPLDIAVGRGNPSRAHKSLGWRHSWEVEEVVAALCSAARSSTTSRS